MADLFEGMFGKVAPGLCRLSMNGGIAIRTRAGYRTYDVEKNRLTNCDHFVLDVGEDLFFVLPAAKVKRGDIILASGQPRCVLGVEGGLVRAISYEDATVDELLPEHHVFMGSACLFGRIVSVFGRNGVKGRRNGLLKYMMLSRLGKGGEGQGLSGLLPMMLLGGKGDLLDDLFDAEEEEDEEEAE